MSDDTLLSILFAALGKIGSKESRRELLDPGSHEVVVRMSGSVDNVPFRGIKIEGTLSIGEETQRTSSSAPPPDEVVAYFLGCLAPRARDQILRSLPDAFAKLGRLPDVDEERLEEAKGLLARLRARRDETASGAVSCRYAVKR